eukprot:CAMPEP_0184519436 /NCGR_PEP_ID=MMETSP0198_2-20121128/6626_1 /TAXON_ID=1112570 /ORGANISM="Thraustochytrium sp., Strain LLF1b" /LENGTH=399 /DNA_ID=CAMNT_0026909953 /DNA_START=379 /DNA_END=1575 /DNA_ORIENTATION=+
MAAVVIQKMYLKLGDTLSMMRFKGSIGSPSCSCMDFKRYARCKHLDIFQAEKKHKKTRKWSSYKMSLQTTKGSNNLDVASEALSTSFESDTEASVAEYSVSSSDNAIASQVVAADIGEKIVPEHVLRHNAELVPLDKVGRGQFGTVHKRSVSATHGIVQVKSLRCQAPTCMVHHQSAFNNELDVLSKLKSHRNLVTFHGYAEEETDIRGVIDRQLVLEFCVDSLQDHIEHRATAGLQLKLLEVRKYAMDIVKATIALHNQGIMHRDITCSNVSMAVRHYAGYDNWSSTLLQHFELSGSLESLIEVDGESPRQPPQSPTRWSAGDSVFKVGSATKWRPNPVFELLQEESTFGPTLEAKLGGFANATAIDGRRTVTRVTSPEAMAPEMWLRKPHNEAIDVW